MAKLTYGKQKELLRELRVPGVGNIVNSHNFCRLFSPNERKVYIGYRNQQPGRGYQCAAWQVIGVGFKTHPDGHWRDYGHKTFNVFAPRTTQYGPSDKQPALEAACGWATDQGYGTEWVRDVFGDYQTPETIAAYHAWLQQQLESAS